MNQVHCGKTTIHPINIGWSAATSITRTQGSYFQYFDVAIDPDGNFMTVWGLDSKIWAERYTPSTGWQQAQRLDSGVSETPKVILDSKGNGLAVFAQSDGIQSKLYSRAFSQTDG